MNLQQTTIGENDIQNMSNEALISTYLECLFGTVHESHGPKRRAYQAVMKERGLGIGSVELRASIQGYTAKMLH